MIIIKDEPEGLLLQKADIMAWADGLTPAQWDKIRPHLTPVPLLGCSKPFYRKSEVKQKLINSIQENV